MIWSFDDFLQMPQQMLPHPKLQLVHLFWRRGNLQSLWDMPLHKWRYLPHMCLGWGGVSHLRPGGHMPRTWNPLWGGELRNGMWGRYKLGDDVLFSEYLDVPHNFRIFVLRGLTCVTSILMTAATATAGCFSIASFSPLLSVLIAPAPKLDVQPMDRSRQKTLTPSRPTNFQMKVSKVWDK